MSEGPLRVSSLGIDERVRYFVDDFLKPVLVLGRSTVVDRFVLDAAARMYGVEAALEDPANLPLVEAALAEPRLSDHDLGLVALRATLDRALAATPTLETVELLRVLRWLLLRAEAVEASSPLTPAPGWLDRVLGHRGTAREVEVTVSTPDPSACDVADDFVVRDLDPGPAFWTQVLTRTRSALRDLPRKARAIVAASFGNEDALHRELAFGGARGPALRKAVVVDEADPALTAPVWFIGDIHGDLLGLEAALACVDAFDARSRVVFLGDLVDDGPYMVEVVLRVLELMLEQPHRFCLLAGNHDEALAFRHEAPQFVTSVSPGDFSEWLNAHAAEPIVASVGRAFVQLVERAPRALFFPDGLLATHAGMPHSDLWAGITGADDLESPACLSDFVWNRMSEDRPIKRPNRTSHGCQYGYEDFFGFCDHMSRVLGRPVRRLIRGHDHVDHERRYAVHAKWQGRAATINNMCFALPREGTYFAPYARMPTIARWIPGKLPELGVVKIPPEAVASFYPPPEQRP